jgi:hypothetical protein
VRGCPLQPVSDYDFTHVSVLLSTRISRITKLIVGNFTYVSFWIYVLMTTRSNAGERLIGSSFFSVFIVLSFSVESPVTCGSMFSFFSTTEVILISSIRDVHSVQKKCIGLWGSLRSSGLRLV